MEYGSLGRTGVRVSRLCLGCMTFGGTTLADSYAIIDRALDAGINFLDASGVCGRGAGEEVAGQALERSGRRAGVVLATRVRCGAGDADPSAAGGTRRHIGEQCEASLRRLRTDWIDLYQIHKPQSLGPIDETLRALDDLIRAGKVRYVGTSALAAWQAVEALWVAKELGLNRFVSEQPPYNILDRRVERELIPMARAYGCAIIPCSPTAGGLLGGKHTRRNAGPPHASAAPLPAGGMGEAVRSVVEALASLAEAKGATMAQLALAWVAQRPGVTSPLIGPRTLAQLEDALGSLAVELSRQDLEKIDGLVPPGECASPFYEADFGPHRCR